MTRLEFTYTALIVDQNDEGNQDSGLVSFAIDFDEQPGSDGFERTCYSVAADEVVNILAEKFGDSEFETLPELTLKISGLTIDTDS